MVDYEFWRSQFEQQVSTDDDLITYLRRAAKRLRQSRREREIHGGVEIKFRHWKKNSVCSIVDRGPKRATQADIQLGSLSWKNAAKGHTKRV